MLSQEMFWLALLDFRVTAKNLTNFPKMVETGLDLAASPDSNRHLPQECS